MEKVTRNEVVAKPDVAEALQGLIAAAVHYVEIVGGSFAERETALLTALQEGGRVALERDLQRMEDALPAEVAVGSEKRLYREHQPGADTYPSLFGDLHVRRRSYREVGVRNGPTLLALEQCAGLIEGATPAFAYNVSEGYGLHDMRTHQKVLASSHRHVPARATLERLARRLAASTSRYLPSSRSCEPSKSFLRALVRSRPDWTGRAHQWPSLDPKEPLESLAVSARNRACAWPRLQSTSTIAWRTSAPSPTSMSTVRHSESAAML